MSNGLFRKEEFRYAAVGDTYLCPGGQRLEPRLFARVITAWAASPPFRMLFDWLVVGQVLAINALIEQEQFSQLPNSVQEWFTQAAGAFNEDKPVPVPEGFVSAFTGASKSKTKNAAVAVDSADKPKGRGRPKGSTNRPKAEKPPKAAKAAKAARPPKAAKEKPATKEPRARTGSIAIREAVVRNPQATAAEIAALIEAEGFKGVNATTIMTIRYDCLATLRVVRDLGKLQDVDLGKYGYSVVNT